MAIMENNVRAVSAIIHLIPTEQLNTSTSGMSFANGHTCLQYTAMHSSLHKMLEYFLTLNDIDVNVVHNGGYDAPRPSPGVTVLRLAVDNVNIGGVAILLKAPDVDVNVTDVDGVAPIHRAVQLGCVDVVAMLARHPSIRLNVQDGRGNSHLHYANMLFGEKGRARMVRLLLSLKDIDVNLRNNDGHRPLDQALELGHAATVRLLCDHPNTIDNIKHVRVNAY